MKLLGSTLLALTQASHFRAGTFQFTPDNTNIDIKVGFNLVTFNFVVLIGCPIRKREMKLKPIKAYSCMEKNQGRLPS